MEPISQTKDYFSRKSAYALGGLFLCDDLRCIRHLVLGWPATVHDKRVWKNCDIEKNQEKYYSDNEYGLGDSAFTKSHLVVASYKKAPMQVVLPPDRQ